MSLSIVQYGHPVLRKKGVVIKSFDDHLRSLADQMLSTMQHAGGVGLAAQQVGYALQLFVIDISNGGDWPSSLELDGQHIADIHSQMPMVFVNFQLEPFGQYDVAVEGCLSFPEVFAEIARPEGVRGLFYDLGGTCHQIVARGFLARVIQHEFDHTQGILFIDRMDLETRHQLRPRLHQIWQTTQKRVAGISTA